MAKDYIEVEYDRNRRPLSTYPEKLAGYVAKLAGMQPGDTLLEFGSGRAEVTKGFVGLGLQVTAVDAVPSAAVYASEVGASFVQATIGANNPFPVDTASYNFVFSKSFVEHLREPVSFLEMCRDLLKPGGSVVCLTPDWEANYRIFFDDVTHVTPFSRVTMQQTLELAGFDEVRAFRFRQLPLTWKNPLINLSSAMIAPFVPLRATNKFLRWSRELMLCGIASRPGSEG